MSNNTIVNLFGREEDAPRHSRRIDLAHSRDFQLGTVTVIPSRRLITGPDSEATLEPKVMQVLVALGDPFDQILSREDLIERCWEGRIVGDASINRVISLLRSALREVAGQAVVLETVPKVGYRILVDNSEASPRPVGAAVQPVPDNPSKLPMRTIAAGGVFALLLAAIGYFLFQGNTAPTQQATIAMLPLQAGGELEPFFAKGLESELRKEMARAEGLQVTSSDTAQQLSLKDRASPEIGEVLEADYIWSGKVMREGESVILDAHLTDVESNQVVWNERLVAGSGQVAALPTRAARSMMRSVGVTPRGSVELTEISQEDFALYLTSLQMIRSRDPEQLNASAAILETLTARNPEFSGGWSALAKALFLAASDSGEQVQQAIASASTAVDRALELDPQSAEAHKVKAVLAETAAEKFRYIERATQLDPGDSEAWLWMSQISAHPDFASHEIEALEQLVAIDPLWGRSWQTSLTMAQVRGVDAGLAIDRKIAAAAAEPWQVEAAEGRMAGMRGDISEARRLTLRSLPAMTVNQQQISSLQLINLMMLTGIDPPLPSQTGPGAVIQRTLNGDLPSRAELEKFGLAGKGFFSVVPLVISGPTQLLKNGRGDELVEYYDMTFASAEQLEAFSQARMSPFHFQTNISTYVGWAMREQGREADAKKLFALAEKSVARWKANDAMTMTPLLFEANLAAALGQKNRALAALEAMIELGYPYVLQSPGVVWTGPILDDPIWDSIREDPEFKALLKPIRENIRRERAQILAATGPA